MTGQLEGSCGTCQIGGMAALQCHTGKQKLLGSAGPKEDLEGVAERIWN